MTATARPFASPAPWRFEHGNYFAADDMSIAFYDKATAQRVVRAVNNHEPMLDALKAIAQHIPKSSAKDGGAAGYSDHVKAADMVRTAIAAAEKV